MSLYSFNEVVKHEAREINYYKYLQVSKITLQNSKIVANILLFNI